MIKIYGTEYCPMCKSLEFWMDKVTLDTEYISVTDSSVKTELQEKYEVTGFPVVVDDNGLLMTFNDCMDLFKQNRKESK